MTGSSHVKRLQIFINLTVEENREYLDACLKGDLVEVADALGDKLYILLGTILLDHYKQ